MTLVVTHGFVSPAADGPDTTKLRPSNWGSAATVTPTHVFGGGALGSLLMRDTVPLDGVSWVADVALGQVLASGGIGAAPAFTATPTLTSLTLGVNPALSGVVAIPNASYLTARNAANTLDKRLIGLSAANVVSIDPDAVGVTFSAGAMTLSAGGQIVLVKSTGSTPSLTSTSDTTTGIFLGDPVGTLQFVVSGQLICSVQSGGWNAAAASGIRCSGTGAKMVFGGADGQFIFENNANTKGIGLDVSGTDAIVQLRTRAFSAYATLDCLGLKASGVAGVNFGPSAVASLTIVNGIVTAAS